MKQLIMALLTLCWIADYPMHLETFEVAGGVGDCWQKLTLGDGVMVDCQYRDYTLYC